MLEEELAARASAIDNQYAGLLTEVVISLGPVYHEGHPSHATEFTISYKSKAWLGGKTAKTWDGKARYWGPYFLIGPSLPELEKQLEERVVGLCSYLEV